MNPSTQTATATHSSGGSTFKARALTRSIVGLLCCAAVAFSTSGCVTTRFGALIPGHTRSEKIKGELVTARYFRLKEGGPPRTKKVLPEEEDGRTKFMVPGGPELASLLAGVAIDAVKSELIREAKRYEHQSSTRLLLTTDELGDEGVIVVTRWIDGTMNASDSTPPDAKSIASEGDKSRGKQRTPQRAFPSQSDVPPSDSLTAEIENQDVGVNGSLSTALNTHFKSRSGKRPAEVLTLRVRREASSVYRVASAKLWVAAVGAKVVKFGWGNLPQFWQWPGALLLRSDSQVEIETSVNIKALQKLKDSEFKWTEIKPESGVLSSIKVNLNEAPKTYDLTNNVGTWLAVPMIQTTDPSGREMGFVVMDFKLNERDSSNAAKYLEDAANAVEKNRGSIIDGVSKAF